MRNLLFVFVCMCSTTSFAQNGFFISPMVGGGVAGSLNDVDRLSYGFIYGPTPTQNIFSASAALNAGYRFRNWEITTGVSVFRSGYSVVYNGGDFVTVAVHERENFYHASVPLTIGYRFNVCDHLFFAPGIGGALSYNALAIANETDVMDSKIDRRYHHKLSSNEFNDKYNRTSTWLTAHAYAGCRVNERMSVIAGPEVQCMAGSLTNSAHSDQLQTNYTLIFNVGITMDLKKGAGKKN